MASRPIIVTLKLLIDRKRNRVIFAEAGKEFVDFLFTFLLTPLGTITNLVTQDHMVGSVGRLYASVQSLSTLFLQPYLRKCDILDPVASKYLSTPSMSILRYLSNFYLQVPLRLNPQQQPLQQSSGDLYRCNNRKSGCSEYISDFPAMCPSCKGSMSTKAIFIRAKVAPIKNIYTNGYVKEEVTFMVSDDLEVKPMSGISSIALLKEFNLKNLEDLDERKVCLTPHEGLMMLKASMQSKTVLTDVFLLRKPQVPNIADDEEDVDYLGEDMETDEDGNEDDETDEDGNEDEETGEDGNEDEDEETGEDGNEDEITVKME